MLATDLLLLALDDDRGTVLPQAAIGLDYGLDGAVVMELALRGRIRLEGGVVSTTGTATDDALLDDALRTIAATPARTFRTGCGTCRAITASTVAATSAATMAACSASSVTCT